MHVAKIERRHGERVYRYWLVRRSVREGKRAVVSPRQLSGRGVSYWTDGRGDERIYYVTTGYRLVALNAKTGSMVSSFGTNGVVDLKQGVVFGNRQPIDLETGEIGIHSTPAIANGCVYLRSDNYLYCVGKK